MPDPIAPQDVRAEIKPISPPVKTSVPPKPNYSRADFIGSKVPGTARDNLVRVAAAQSADRPETHIRTSHSVAELQALRDETRVGREAYGEGLVNRFHKKTMTVPEHEQAQEQAYAALSEKIDRGVVSPASIGADVLHKLGVTAELGTVPTTQEGVVATVTAEVRALVDRGHITPEEAGDITGEMAKFVKAYQAAYPDKDIATVFELTRDNARKLAYQIKMDKNMFSGSDHGNLHLLRGNVRFAEQMIADLKKLGLAVSAKDEVLIRQNMYDHDLGYAQGAAQSKEAFDAMKDHPLLSAKFIEENKAYYVAKFGEAEYDALRYVVLNHSYPTSEYDNGLRNSAGINTKLIRSITSTVDSLGVTAETKVPDFFRKRETVKSLMKIRLAMEVRGTDDGKGNKVLPAELMDKYKEELRAIARSSGESEERVRGYLTSIDNFMNEMTVDLTLGQFAGVVKEVGAVKNKDGKVVPRITMQLSDVQALLGNMFGGKVETQAFVKVMSDFGMDEFTLQRLVQYVGWRSCGVIPATTDDDLVFNSPEAHFTINDHIAGDGPQEEFGELRGVMKGVAALSARSEINELLRYFGEGISAEKRYMIPRIIGAFIGRINDKTSPAEVKELGELADMLAYDGPTDMTDEGGFGMTRAQYANKRLQSYLTQNERDFLGISE
ncbi:hypothetical protein HY214_03135 [Candidatus Roizmanbacteria bacterium]|nr:hypothetical protein [Candidatus Roizmanbacteria bacterium]